MFNPERPTEPKEPRYWTHCSVCGDDICVGERYYKMCNEQVVCETCYEDAVEFLAGVDDE